MGSTVPRTFTSGPDAVYDAPVSPDTGPRWYETPLWFVAQVAAFVVGARVFREVLPDDLGIVGRTFSSGVFLVVMFWGAVAIRGRLRRRDA
jgi:hypothetical protein